MPEYVIQPGEAARVDVRAGQSLTIIDVKGKQVGDFISCLSEDPHEYLSPNHTAVVLGRFKLRVGDTLVSNTKRPLWKIERDDVGVHDFHYPPCDPYRYRQQGASEDHPSCRVALQRATGLPYRDIPNPLNVFMATHIDPDGSLHIDESPSFPGAQFVLTCLCDQLAALSACPADLNACNGFAPTELILRVD